MVLAQNMQVSGVGGLASLAKKGLDQPSLRLTVMYHEKLDI